MNRVTAIAVVGLVLACASGVSADTFGTGANQFTIDFVPISGSTNPSSGYGIVNNDYRMGVYEITNDQWNKFKAAYGTVTGNESNAYDDSPVYTGTNVPTNNVSWYEAAQFVNWLNTSTGHQAAYKFTGTQGTDDYTLATWSAAEADGGTNLYRHKDAMYFLPTEDEWLKAGYWNGTTLQYYATRPGDALHQGDGVSGTGWNYWDDGWAIDPPGPWDVGSGGEELNGTYDIMGNVVEWMESPFSDSSYGATSYRGARGGSYTSTYGDGYLASHTRSSHGPWVEGLGVGFRVASEVPELTTLLLPLDIKPGSCPNPLNLKSQGKLPVALLGTEDFDVSLIDVASISLARADGVGGNVSPYDGPPGPYATVEDVGTPFDGELCDCHEVDGDGIDDLSIKFSRPEVVAALGLAEFDPGATVELVVSGELQDGTSFAATDCILIVPQPDFDEDNDVDQSDFGHLQACYRGPMKTVDLACEDADIDGDGDVDISDFGWLQRCISGAAKAVDPRCAD